MTCILCEGRSAVPLWGEDLVQCTTCSLVRAADRFFEVAPDQLYGAEYFTGAEYVDYRGDRRAVHRNSDRRIGVLRRLAPHARTLLEIGCGYGYFLESAAPHWSASGIEISAHAANEARQQALACIEGDYLSLPPAETPPDIVCLWDTIEHLAAPDAVIEKVASEMAPGGLVAISTGDISGMLPLVQRRRWRLIHPPTHLWYFSAATLGRLLQRLGFRVVRVTHPPFYRSLRLYLRSAAAYLPRAVGDWPVPLQTWDLMEVYAERTSAVVSRSCVA